MRGALCLVIVLAAAAVPADTAASVQFCTDSNPDGVKTNIVCPGPRFASLLSLADARALAVHDLTRVVVLPADDNPICSIFLTDFSSRDQFLGASGE